MAPVAGHAGVTQHPARPTSRLQWHERFRQFVRTIFPRKQNGTIDENAVYLIPLLAINPMAKDHVRLCWMPTWPWTPMALEPELPQKSRSAGRRAGDFKVGLVVADDLMGAGTNRYNDEFTFRFGPDQFRSGGRPPKSSPLAEGILAHGLALEQRGPDQAGRARGDSHGRLPGGVHASARLRPHPP